MSAFSCGLPSAFLQSICSDDVLIEVHTLQLVVRSLKELVTMLSLPLLLTITGFFLVLILLPVTLLFFSISFTLTLLYYPKIGVPLQQFERAGSAPKPRTQQEESHQEWATCQRISLSTKGSVLGCFPDPLSGVSWKPPPPFFKNWPIDPQVTIFTETTLSTIQEFHSRVFWNPEEPVCSWECEMAG